MFYLILKKFMFIDINVVSGIDSVSFAFHLDMSKPITLPFDLHFQSIFKTALFY